MIDTPPAVFGVRFDRGDHVCGFYRQPAERDDIIVPFLAEGLAAGEVCTCVVDSCSPQHVLSLVGERTDVERHVAERRLEVFDSASTYLADGRFLPERMLRFWSAKAARRPNVDGGAADAGPGVARNVGDMSWAHHGDQGAGELGGYESALNRVMADCPHISLCLYDLSKCSGDLVVDVLKTHPKVLLGGMVIDNPYYLRPEEFLLGRR